MLSRLRSGRLRIAALLGLLALAVTAGAQVTYTKSFDAPVTVAQYDGSTTPAGGSPTFNRPFGSGNASAPPASLSSIGTNALYDAYTFTAPRTDTYTITATAAAAYGIAAYLYQTSFNPASPLTNILAGDNPGGAASVVTLTQTLNAGNTYVLVTTSYNNGVAGSFTDTITSPSTTNTPVYMVSDTTRPAGASPTYNRPAGTTSLSEIGTNVFYKVHSFTAPTNGVYSIASSTTYDNYLFLYHDSFDPANPLANIISAAEGSPNSGSLTNQSLTGGVTYYIVETTYANGMTGPYSLTVSTAPTTGAPTYTSSGTTGPNTSNATFNRPNANGTSAPTSLSTTGTSVYYQAQTFTVTATGTYNIVSQCVSPASWDNFTILYAGAFDPANPLTNAVIANDDLNGAASSGFTTTLTAGVTYTLVTTAYANGKTGTFTDTVTPAPAPATLDSWSGNTLGGLTFHRPSSLTTQASATLNYGYDKHTWTATVTGPVSFTSTCVSPAGWDNYTVLYSGTFNPATPLTPAPVAFNDDLNGANSSGFTYNVTAGVTYTLVTTAYYDIAYSTVANRGGTYNGAITQTVTPSPVVNYSSGLTAGTGGTYSRVDANGTGIPTTLSATATATYYDAKTFTVPTTGAYLVLSAANTPANWNNYTALYSGTFNPASPLANVIIANDNQPSAGMSGFSVTLTAGTAYTLVTSGNTNSDFGTYTVSVAPITGGGNLFSFSGNLMAGTGTPFDRPDANGTSAPAALSASATATFYKANTFTVPNTGLYSVLSQSTTPANWDNYTILYSGTFNPASPLTNAVIANDNQPSAGVSGFSSIMLTKGVTYTLVTAGATNDAYGEFNVTVAPIAASGVSLTHSGATTVGTGPNFNRPEAGTPPTTLSTTAAADFYHTYSFIPTATGLYSVASATSNPSGWTSFFAIYDTTFDPANPLSHAVAASVGPSLSATLTAGKTYVIVTTGSTNADYGTFHNVITTGPASYPPVIPDNNSAGLPLTNTVADTFKVASLNSVKIVGLHHTFLGDLSALLTHKGVTIELFDRVGRLSNSASGSSQTFDGDYTFAPGGADLGSATGPAIAPAQTYRQYLNGTAGESYSLVGDFSTFNGLGVDGDWTLKIIDGGLGITGSYTGFSFTVTPVAMPFSGTANLEGVVYPITPAIPLDALTVYYFAANSAAHNLLAPLATQIVTINPANGAFSFTPSQSGSYDLEFKTAKSLAVLKTNVNTAQSRTGLVLNLPGGDANNDNSVDSSDFSVLIGVFNTEKSIAGSGYDPTADFNYDGSVDSSDFAVLISEFNNAGE